MLTARERIERQMADPSLIRLHRKLSRLKSTVTMMNTGAHPDDERNEMLAWFRLGLGMRVIIACSTRGEGGQNALGPERLGPLGVLRSRELEAAAHTIDSDITWLGHGPADPVHDFGFSKDGDATFTRWGEARVVERLVRAYRMERPDIVIPTFLDVPGQHGHHRAMTRAAETAIGLAADPKAYPEHFTKGLKPWRVTKYYLPAWSGGGSTYDDEVPPPDATVTVLAEGREPATGAEYGRIGEWSRYYHASQGMGHWPKQAQKAWPLHLKLSAAGSNMEQSVLEGLSASLTALAEFPGLPANVAAALRSADSAIAVAISAFPDRDAIVEALTEAACWLDIVASSAPEEFMALHGHRLVRKQAEVDAAILDAAAIFESAYADPSVISPGGAATLTVELGEGASGRKVEVLPVLPECVSSSIRSLAHERIFALTAASDAPLTGLYLPGWSALGGNGHAHVNVSAEIGGRTVSGTYDLAEPFAVAPAQSLTLLPDALLVPLGSKQTEWAIKADISGANAPVSFKTPVGWTMKKSDGGWIACSTGAAQSGLIEIEPQIDGRPAFEVTPISYRHVGRASFRAPATLKILSLDLKFPEGARVGYVGGGADRVGLWLTRMGLDVTALDAAALSGDLSRFSTIVVGIFAFGIRKDLAAAAERLHRFVENGGHLVTLYHRPSDGWDPMETPVRRIEIGSPSLRWRVTDPRSEVTVLAPDHILLKGPNVICPEDWQGWDKERGLYFASRWDDAYEPLLAVHDPDEQPLKGALISAAIGKGRHTHTSLVLHHQMDKLVPGAFRLMANLVQAA
ncbi:PIG-L family deacetylase [Rhizobium sp. P32RR-XVIII]|uniref:PIG-L family deacetylase n=1 Tax=Rhizobium sp. P32RR-XVIII TaxID=2726738 RepID=UPI0014566B0E|nr:PIG-L family deacetylase [Rhizobium sp. P32RR-XVIII]NLS08149.1 PIG-L family deacetylase [Rhizobium sp. P32RR-XVIII]